MALSTRSRPLAEALLPRVDGSTPAHPPSAAPDQHPRPRLRPHAAADAVSAVLRDVQGRHQEHVDRRRDRLLRRPRRPRPQADAGREAPDQPPRGVLRHRRLDRGQQLVLNLYSTSTAPEARMYLSRAALRRGAARPVLFEPCSTTTSPTCDERAKRFAAIENIPSIRPRPSSASSGWNRSRRSARDQEERKRFLMNLICFATCIEGLFFFAAFAYVYFLRSQGPAQRARRRHQLGVPRRVDAT